MQQIRIKAANLYWREQQQTNRYKFQQPVHTPKFKFKLMEPKTRSKLSITVVHIVVTWLHYQTMI